MAMSVRVPQGPNSNFFSAKQITACQGRSYTLELVVKAEIKKKKKRQSFI
jgi:hypothetical protein